MPEYRVQVYDTDSSAGFAPGDMVAEFAHAKNIGYANYLNDVGEAFWTINQGDINARAAVKNAEGHGHVKIIRNGDVVWRGILAEHDANQSDAILYAYSYESLFYTLLSFWNMTWESKSIAGASGRPVNDLWSLAKGTYGAGPYYPYSPLEFATTGTLQAPVTTSNGSTAITLESYKLYWRRLLFAFKELSAIASSDTTNICYFELAFTNDPTDDDITFNFWKDRSTDITQTRLYYPDTIVDWSDRNIPILDRNDLRAVGTGAREQLFRSIQQKATGAKGYQTVGRKMEPIYLSWVRDEAELDRVAKLRLARALRDNIGLYLRLRANQGVFLPTHATGATHNLGDRIKVKIDRGVTQVDGYLFLEGEQVIYVNGAEYVQPMLSERAGSE